jgi:hypothetical protein
MNTYQEAVSMRRERNGQNREAQDEPSRQLARARRAVALAAVLGTLLFGAVAAQAASAYANPFAGDQVSVGRTDMGLDVCLSRGDAIRAVGNGVVVGIIRNWYEGKPYIWYRLNDGPDAGRYVYVAEQINDLAPVGLTVRAGDVIARIASKGTCVEAGWAAGDGETLAQATTDYTEGQVTAAGVSFAHFLASLGVRGNLAFGATTTHGAPATKAKTATTPSRVRARSGRPRPPWLRRQRGHWPGRWRHPR